LESIQQVTQRSGGSPNTSSERAYRCRITTE
jgi:hypothetical protein